MKRHSSFVFLLAAAPGWGRLDGVIGTASRAVSLTAVDAVFQITVNTDQTKTRDGVVPKLKDLNVSAEHLLNISFQQFGPPPAPGRLVYLFRILVPIARIKETQDKIAQIRRNEADSDVQGVMTGIQPAASAVEEARRRSFSELFREARARAEGLAREAGMTTGRVLSITEAPVGAFFPGMSGPLAVTVSVSVRVELQ
jgi:hypothetical protein